jgi:hypothetical protein
MTETRTEARPLDPADVETTVRTLHGIIARARALAAVGGI